MPTTLEPTAAQGAAQMPPMPLLPDNYLSAVVRGVPAAVTPTTSTAAPTAPTRGPEISLASLGSAVAALSEADGGAGADALGLSGSGAGAGAKEVGAVRQVWSGFLDDLLGAEKVTA